MAIPLDTETIGDDISYFQKAFSKDKDVLSFLLEEDDICSVDNLQARYRLYSFNAKSHILQKYHFICIVQSEQFSYVILAFGDYKDLKIDRKNIDEIIANIKIIK